MVALLVALGWLVATWPGPSAWQWSEGILLAGFAVVFAVICMTRPTAYKQRLPWLATTFFVSALIAMLIVFSRWNTVWFLLAMCTGSAILAIASAARTKTISEPFARTEIFRLVSLAGSILLGLIVLEAFVRVGSGLFDPEIRQLIRANPSDYGVGHPYIGHLHTPSSRVVVSGRDFEAVHQVDPLGFRNAWPWPAAPVDIVVVGDSVSFGHGVADERAWPFLLAQSAPDIRLVNLSLVGAGPQQYLRVFETFGLKLRPKLLLVGVWAINDFTDAIGFEAWEQSGAGGNDLVWRDFGRPGRRVAFSIRRPIATLEGAFRTHIYPWLRRSHLYNLNWALRGGWSGPAGPSASTFITLPDGSPLRLDVGYARAAAAAAQPSRREFQLLLNSLSKLRQIAATDLGTPTLMVLQPSKQEVYVSTTGEKPVDLTQALRDAFDQRGIQYVDLAPAFRKQAAAGMRLYREVDTHPNEAGYALISELLVSYLAQHKRLDSTVDSIRAAPPR